MSLNLTLHATLPIGGLLVEMTPQDFGLLEIALLCPLAIAGGGLLAYIMSELGADYKSARRRLYGSQKRKDEETEE